MIFKLAFYDGDGSEQQLVALAKLRHKGESMSRKWLVAVLSAAILVFPTFAVFAEGTQDEEAVGAVYTMTNDNTGNQVVIFNRGEDGTLTRGASISTGGLGSGGAGVLDPLGSQGSITLSSDARWLLAVNAGSNEISVFRVLPNGLLLVDKVGSGGVFPVSVTVSQDRVYVLNAREGSHSPNITGFTLSHTGELTPLADSTRPVSGGPLAAFAQVGFDPEGETLVVTDKGDKTILVYAVGDDGRPAASPVVSASNGFTPFGLIFDERGHLLVVEAGTNAVSSYAISRDGTLEVISPSVANGQKAACWIVGNERGNVFTANPGSATISSYKEDVGNGTLTLVAGAAGPGLSPLDLSIAKGRFLYAVDPKAGGIDAFRIEEDGSLASLGTVAGGLSLFSQGIAAR
jgi:6-phosphogluconolactonase